MPFPVLARTVRGIEWIARDEVRSRLGIDAIDVGHRELRFSLPGLAPGLVELGTVDDVFLVLAEIDGLTRRRESLSRLASLSLDLDEVARLLGRDGPHTVGVTASFLGRRNYNRFELEDAVAAATDWAHVDRDGTLSLRMHVVDEVATVAVRIARTPLHRRAYRVATVPGSVHPPLARALALLAGVPFVDPFCGAGTIPIEGALAGLATRGGDTDPRAIEAARLNAASAGVDVSFEPADAASLGAVDCIVTNPPWGKAVPGTRVSLQAERLVLLTAEPTGLDHIVLEQTVRVHGALATITVVERPGPSAAASSPTSR
jgi:tRNA (guanine6-N2)-methyltransferase